MYNFEFEVNSVILNAPSCSNCAHFTTDSNCEPICPLMEQGKIRESYPAKVPCVGFGSCSEWKESETRKKLLKNLPFELSDDGKTLVSVNDDAIEDLEQAIIPYGVEIINDDAFNCCTNLKNVFIPESVRKIGSSAFSDCSSLKEVQLPSSLEEIELGAFHHCTHLEKINIPAKVRVLDQLVFSDCLKLNTVIFSNIHIPFFKSNLEKICQDAFMNCSSLRNIRLPKGLKTVERWAFRWCDPLPEGTLEFPEGCNVDDDIFDPE